MAVRIELNVDEVLLELARDDLLCFMDEMNRCRQHGLWTARYYMSLEVRARLFDLGGLMGVW